MQPGSPSISVGKSIKGKQVSIATDDISDLNEECEVFHLPGEIH